MVQIDDLKVDDYVVFTTIRGREVTGRITCVDHNLQIVDMIDFYGNTYVLDNNCDIELWKDRIEDKTESVSESFNSRLRKNIEAQNEYLNSLVKPKQSNDLQQRKRKEKLVRWSDDVKLKFIERAIKDLSPLAAYHIGNAIDVLAVAESKEDIEQARWSIQRAFENWDVK